MQITKIFTVICSLLKSVNNKIYKIYASILRFSTKEKKAYMHKKHGKINKYYEDKI